MNFSVAAGKAQTVVPTIDKIMPYGVDYTLFKAYLDMVADYAIACVTDDGTPIPILYRPWHENNGEWFWWGATNTTPDEYIHLFRFTVEYLRDVRDVHNLLYVYSPNGPFPTEESYLYRYPGDEYVDVLGIDYYNDNPPTGDNQEWLDSLLVSARNVVNIAQARGKIATLSESGLRYLSDGFEGLLQSGNRQLNWFLDVLNTI